MADLSSLGQDFDLGFVADDEGRVFAGPFSNVDLQAVRRVVRALKQIPVSSDADRKRRSELEREVAVHSTSALLGSWVYSAFSAPDQMKRRAQGW